MKYDLAFLVLFTLALALSACANRNPCAMDEWLVHQDCK